jgi:hypothetical protein
MSVGRSLAKSIALLALVTVISSAQCFNFCAVHPCNEARPAPVNDTQSCHHSPGSSKSQPTEQRSSCSHQPLLMSEKAASVGTTELLASGIAIPLQHSTSLYTHAGTVPADPMGSPPTQQRLATVVLRI